MTRDEAKKIIMVISAIYPNWKPDNMPMTIDAWHFMLNDYTYQQISVALKSFITTSGSAFAPSVSELIQILDKPNEINGLTESQAWAMVRHALSDSIYHSAENYDMLPETVQKAVGSAEQLRIWAMRDDEAVDSVIMSNFQRAYRKHLEQEKLLRLMPTEMKALIGETANKLIGEKHELEADNKKLH